MKNSKKILYPLLALLMVFSVSCEKDSDTNGFNGDSIELPPYESMVVDFSGFLQDSESGKVASTAKVEGNWLYPRLAIGFWNTALLSHLAVPIASFKAAFAHEAEFLGDNTWQWTYSVNGFTSEYTARLTGELGDGEILWKMYITKVGIEGFEEFLWFSGISDLDGMGGEWTLNQSAEHPDAMLKITWSKENDEIGSVKYTWVREMNEEGNDDPFKESYLEYGLQEGDYDVFYDIHVFDIQTEAFVDVSIEWSSTEFNGRVMAPSHFEDEMWHCWDSSGADVACE